MPLRFANDEGWWQDLKSNFIDTYGEGREDQLVAHHRERQAGKHAAIEAPRGDKLVATNRTLTYLRDLMGKSNPEAAKVRDEMGMGLAPTVMGRVGQAGGVLAGDLTQDRSREAWWLINAPQALVNVGQEMLLNSRFGNPKLFSTDVVKVKDPMTGGMRELTTSEEDEALAIAEDLIDEASGNTKKGVYRKNDRFYKRLHEPGHVDALMIPAGIATNAGIGLLNPFGGTGGYDAVFPGEEDRTKTDNVIAEVGAKYILGRTGNLAPWDEFKKHRPDVSKGEYNAYKAFKWDKETDMDVTDGDFTVATGVVKGTMDGIHGPEIQFLGRSLPATTALLPIAATVGGVVAGARGRNPKLRGFATGMASLAGSTGLGLAIEDERRRRNGAMNFPEDPMYSN